MMPYLASAGVKNLGSICANVWPAATRQYVAMALSHQNNGFFPLWNKPISALFQVASPTPVKVLMAELNIICSAKLRLPLCEKGITAQHGLRYTHQKIQQWLENNSNNSIVQHHESNSSFNAVAPQSLATTNLREINQ